MKSCEHNYPVNSECPICELEEAKKQIVLLEKALLDLLDGNQDWIDIKRQTGLPDDRCKELTALYCKLLESKQKGK